MWTDAQWRSFCLLVDRPFPGDFDEADREVWRMFLDEYEPERCVAALKAIVASGQTFRPSIGDMVGALLVDPSAPTFAEMVQLVYGPGGILHARPTVTRWASERERRALCAAAMTERAQAAHPLIAAFVHSHGIERLRQTNLDDPDWGNKHRGDLKREWEEFTAHSKHRQAAALTAGDEPRAGLHRFSPLAALGQGRKQITEGGRA